MPNPNLLFENLMEPLMDDRLTRRPATGDRTRFWRVAAFLLIGSFIWACWPQAARAEYQQLELAADIKSRFSTGCSSIQELMTQAEFKGLDGLLFGDHDRQTLQYGLPYLERVLKINIGRPALLDNGPAAYLSEINQIDRTDDSLVLVPGVESAPFYYWTGNPLDQNLVAHNWDKHLLIVGLPTSRDYEEMPILNGSLTTRYLEENYLAFTLFCVLALIGFFTCMVRRWRFRGMSFLFAVAMALLAANAHPFKSSPFDQYQGDLGVEPYQHLIDYAGSKGALVFWNHLETPVLKKLDSGPLKVKIRTDNHSQDLLLTRDYTGFQALNDAPVSAVNPGQEWDQVLMQYIGGQRDRPVWGYGANDFHCEGQGQGPLGGVRTILLVEQKNRAAVMEALRAGRMYAVKQQDDKNRLSLDTFELVDPATGKRAVMGENLNTGKPPGIALKLSMKNGSESRATLKLIRNGKVIKKAVLRLPFEGVWQDSGWDRSQPAYYRLLIEADSGNRLVSNPIFLNSGPSGKTVVASAKADPSPVHAMRKNFTPLPPKKQPEPAPQTQPQWQIKPDPQIEPPVATSKQEAPKASLPEAVAGEKYVEVTARSVRLRKGPGITFPVSGNVGKGDRLLFVRRTEVIYKGRAWIVIKKNGQLAYVWEGLVNKPQEALKE